MRTAIMTMDVAGTSRGGTGMGRTGTIITMATITDMTTIITVTRRRSGRLLVGCC